MYSFFPKMRLNLRIFRYDATSEDLIDVIEGNRVYMPCIYVLNKVREFNEKISFG